MTKPLDVTIQADAYAWLLASLEEAQRAVDQKDRLRAGGILCELVDTLRGWSDADLESTTDELLAAVVRSLQPLDRLAA